MSAEGKEVEIFLDGDELLVEGARSDINAVLKELSLDRRSAGRGEAAGIGEVGPAIAATSTAAALAATSRELYELTPAARTMLEQFGVAPTADGAMAGVVRSSGSIRGHLSFNPVSMGPEQVLALQTAAMSIALRSAIADVEKAVKALDGKVEDLQRRARAAEVGEVVGLCRDLEHVVKRTQTTGRLLEADWQSVASCRRDLVVALERLRAYVTEVVDSTDVSDGLQERVEAVEAVSSSEKIGGALRLIAVAEHALHLWYYLYVERVRSSETEHTADALGTARGLLQEHRRLDGELVSQIFEHVAQLQDVRPLEVHRRWSIKSMDAAASEAMLTLAEFEDRVRLSLPDRDLPDAVRPQLADARKEVRRRAKVARHAGREVSVSVGKAAKSKALEGAKRVRRSPSRKK